VGISQLVDDERLTCRLGRYTISLLATLNGRKSVGIRTSTSSGPLESVGMRLEVSRFTQRTTTSEVVPSASGEWSEGEGKEPSEVAILSLESFCYQSTNDVLFYYVQEGSVTDVKPGVKFANRQG